MEAWLPIDPVHHDRLPVVGQQSPRHAAEVLEGMHHRVQQRLGILPIPESALVVLRSLPQGGPGDAVFAGVDAAHLSVYCKRVLTRIGAPDASFHTLRHTATSWMV